MVALELVLTLACALTDPTAPRADGGELYTALTDALERGAFSDVRSLAARIPADTTLGRKAAALARLTDAFESRGPVAQDGIDWAAGDSVEVRSGTLRMSLAPDGAFAAAVCPEHGAGGYRAILFGHPAPFTSRVSLSVDGEARMPPRGRPYPIPGGGVVDLRDGDLAVQVSLTGGAAPPFHPQPDATAGLRIGVSVRNDGARSHRVGLRLLLDVAQGFDDAPAVAVLAGSARSVLATTTVFEGDSVPPSLGVGDRALVLRGLGAPAPERVIVTPLEPALAAAFDFAADEAAPLSPDVALAIYSEPIDLAPGASRSFAVQFVPRPRDFERAAPLATSIFTEPVATDPDATRVVLALANDLPGNVRSVAAVSARASIGAGLETLALPDDLDRLGTLGLGALVTRSVVVRPDRSRGGPLEVAFDVSGGVAPDRATRRVTAQVQAAQSLSIAGVIRDVQGRAVPDCDVVLVKDGRDEARTRSDGAGNYRFDGVPPGPHGVRASRVVWFEPAAKLHREDLDNVLRDVVLTSETIDNQSRHVLPEVLPGSGRDIVLARSLTRYSVFVSVEWDAPREYLEGIARGMRRAAEFLYGISGGQLTYGRVSIRDCAQEWPQADLWDWCNNSVHPNADVAGIRHLYDPVTTPWSTGMNFGRQWGPSWDEIHLFSTVVHEFGHYGLGLYDEYLGAPQGQYRGLAYWEMCRCFMGYQYSDHMICWEGNHHWYTNQGMWNGMDCWSQIERDHEGMRGGFYAPVVTAKERGGLVIAEVPNHVGDDLRVSIRDRDTGGFQARLTLAGPFGTNLPGCLVYSEVAAEHRVMFEGYPRGDGSLDLMGAHVGDKVWGLWNGMRAEFTIGERRDRYVLEFGSEPGEHVAPAPLVSIHPERVSGAFAGASIEITPFVPPTGAPTATIIGGDRPQIALTRTGDAASSPDARWVGSIGADRFTNGRATIEIVMPDAVQGDRTTMVDVVMSSIGASESESAAFDGALKVRFAAGAVPADSLLAIASAEGPTLALKDARVVGRVHAIFPSGEPAPFAAPVLLVFAPLDGAKDCEPRRFDETTRTFVPIDGARRLDDGSFLAPLTSPGFVALCIRG